MHIDSLYLKVGSTRTQVFCILGFSKQITEFIEKHPHWSPCSSKVEGCIFFFRIAIF